MKKILFQISTHWDREWYLPFQEFRYQLVEMTDRLLDELEKGTIPEFVFDGQTIVLEDYLEIRPENRDRLAGLIKAGKLIIGPWYVMPDEFLVSGEGLIENLLEGQRAARKFHSEPWKFGYVCDIFGHTAQMPQIFNGFGIKGAFIGRGIPSLPDGTDFLWRSPDGSECVTRKDNYSNFRSDFCRSSDKNASLKRKAGDAALTLLNFSGDHASIDNSIRDFLKCLEESDYDIAGGFIRLPELVQRDALPEINGELIETAHKPDDFRVVNGSVSSYYPLKRQNDITEDRLFTETAPLLVMGELMGLLEGKRNFFLLARRYLLKNHPHDSICGCSIDLVHQDMPYRFRQAQAISHCIRTEFCRKLSELGKEFALTVVNTDVHKYEGILTIPIDFPKNWETVYTDNTGYQSFNMFAITDASGRELPYQILKIERDYESYIGQDTILSDRYTIAVDAALLPFGFTRFWVGPRQKRNAFPPASPETCTTENEFLKLEIEADGSLTMTDKNSGKTFRHLHEFIDDADSGNGWFHEPAAFDEARVLSCGGCTRIEIIHRGNLVNTFRVTKEMEIPSELDAPEKCRSKTYNKLRITSDITLRGGQKYVEFVTTVDNQSSEHRLRVVFPSGIPGDNYFSSQAFCFVERPRGSSETGYAGRETEYAEKRTSGIVGTGDLAFVGVEGFHEAGVYPDGSICATMFRSVGKMFQQPHSETAKLLGKMQFHYALAVGCVQPELIKIQREMQSDYPVVYRDTGLSRSFLSVSDERIQMSTIKPAENSQGFIVRLYNPSDSPITCKLLCEKRLSEVSMSEENAVPRTENLTFGAYEIKTLLLTEKQ